MIMFIKKWLIAEDGDGIICPKCSTDYCTMMINMDKYNYCPNCGKHLKRLEAEDWVEWCDQHLGRDKQ